MALVVSEKEDFLYALKICLRLVHVRNLSQCVVNQTARFRRQSSDERATGSREVWTSISAPLCHVDREGELQER